MRARWVRRGIKVAVVGVIAVVALGFAVMTLWNWLGPAVFGLRGITFWQALGILILSKILFGGFRGRRGGGGRWGHRMNARWNAMTPEEREKFREGMLSRCGRAGAAGVESPAARSNM